MFLESRPHVVPSGAAENARRCVLVDQFDISEFFGRFQPQYKITTGIGSGSNEYGISRS